MKALIDADLLVYSIGYIKNADGSTRAWPKVASNVDQSISNIIESSGCSTCNLYITSTDRSNFRYSTATIKEYKGNRKTDKPDHYLEIREFLEKDREARVVRFWEADDQLGIDQTEETVICSLDKDLDMIPGWHYNWNTRKKYYVNELESLHNFYCQLLTGDTVDNILGLFGVGPKSKYLALVKACDSEAKMFFIVQEMYEKYYGSYWQQFLEENAKLLWILREEVPIGCHPEDQVVKRLGNMMLESIALA